MTSRLVTEGKLPYHDFLLTQMPLLPYLYGWWMHVAGMTWISARLLSAILTAALGTALYSDVREQTGRRAAGMLAILLFASSTHVLAWFTVIKTYTLSTLLLFLAYRFIVRCADRPMLRLTAAGLLLGASADARLYFAGLLPVFLWWISRCRRAGTLAASFLPFLAGFAIATAPNLYLLVRDPQAYYFGNLGFHAIRSPQGLIGGFDGKVLTVARLVLAGGEGNGLQIAMFVFLILLLALRPGIVTGPARLVLTLGLVLSFICVLPTPSYVQYFCVTIPFFIAFVVCSLNRLFDTMRDPGTKRHLAAACAFAMLVFVASAIPAGRRFLFTGEGVTGIGGPAQVSNWRISSVLAVSQAIDARIQPGERVLSLWPGYIFQSKAEPYAGLENNSGTFLAERLSPAQLVRYHVLSPRRILADIADRTPRLVVLGNQESMLIESEPFENKLIGSGYRVASKIGGASLWVSNPPFADLLPK